MIPRGARFISLGFLLTFLAGCSDFESDLPPTATFDTVDAGWIEVVNSGNSVWNSRTGWRLEEDLRLGTGARRGSEDEEFGNIQAVTSDSRGNVYILDSFLEGIQVFDSAGEFSHTIGGEGEGPGEFLAPRALSIGKGDTLVVLDDGNARYSVFDETGEFLSSFPRRVMGYMPSLSGGILPDGSLLDWGIVFPEGRFGERAIFTPIRFPPGFGTPDSLPAFEHRWTMLASGRMPDFLFGGTPVAAADGEGFLWLGHSQEYRLVRRTLAGDTTIVASIDVERAALEEDDRGYVREQIPEGSGLLSEYLEGLPEVRPVLHKIVPDNAGHLFVFVDVANEPRGSTVDVFLTNGVFKGRLQLPAPVSLDPRRSFAAHATAEHLYLVVNDELDVPYVARLKIWKRP